MLPTRREALVAGAGIVALPALRAADADAGSNVDDRPRPPGGNGRAPILFTTAQELERARDRAGEGAEPFATAWQRTLQGANSALDRTYTPEQSHHHEDYFGLGKDHAQDVRSLALAFHVTNELKYADKGREILALWAEDALNGPYPSAGSPHSAGLVIGRVIPIFADGYAMLWSCMTWEERQLVEKWFTHMLEPIRESRQIWETADELCDYGNPCASWPSPWLNQQFYNNHLGAQNMGIMAIGFATGDKRVATEALRHPHNPRNLKDLLEGVILMEGDTPFHEDPTLTGGAPAVQDGEIYDRYRVTEGRGLHYAHIHLRFLVLQADMAANNHIGRDWFSYVGSHGENIKLPFEFYSQFLLTGDSGARGGYYTGSAVDYGLFPLYEIAVKQYPKSQAIRHVIESFDRLIEDTETFGWTLPLTDGVDGIPQPEVPYPESETLEWNFDTDDDYEGWTIRKAPAAVENGSLVLEVNGRDPGIVSPPFLGFRADEYPRIQVAMSNTTEDQLAELFFITDADTSFDSQKSHGVSVTSGPDFSTWEADMSAHPEWSGRIRQIRIDPVRGDTHGTVRIDSVRITGGE